MRGADQHGRERVDVGVGCDAAELQRYTRDEWLDQAQTTGALTWLPRGKVAQVLAGLAAAIDAMGGRFTVSYTTVALTAARAGTA